MPASQQRLGKDGFSVSSTELGYVVKLHFAMRTALQQQRLESLQYC